MEGLGINLRYLLFQLGNFIVLLIGLTYLLHKPLQKLLDARKKEIKEGLELAAHMKDEAAKAEERQRELLEKAQTEAANMLRDAKQQAKEMEERLEAQAEEKAAKILSQAEQDIANEKVRMKEELRGELADLVVQASEKVLGSPLADKEKNMQAKKIVQELN